MKARRKVLAVPLALALGLAGCPAEPAADQPVIRSETEPVPVETAATQRAELRDMLGIGLSGEVLITPFPDSVVIHLSLEESGINAIHPARLQRGTCDAPGEVVAVVEAILTGALGNGRSQRTLAEEDARRILSRATIVALYGPGGEPGIDPPVACGELPGATGDREATGT
jgi:hypothetical protein